MKMVIPLKTTEPSEQGCVISRISFDTLTALKCL
jgi:hypothetical protein